MIQNSRITRFSISFFLSAAVVSIPLGWAGDAFSQIVNSAAFDTPADHSILEVADEEVTWPQTNAAQLSPAPLTKIAHDDATYDAPAAPQPRMTGAKPLAPSTMTFGGDSQGTFAGSNLANKSANGRGLSANQVSQLQPPHGINRLRTNGLQPAPQDEATNPTSAKYEQEDQTEEPKYESAYLHDQQPQHDTPVEDLFRSPANSHPLSSTAQQPKPSLADENFQSSESNFIQQTAFLSPAAPAQPQFQNTGVQQQHQRQFGQPQTQHRGQQHRPAQIASQGQRTRQRNLPRQNQIQSQQPTQTQPTDLTAAKQAIAKFSFDANQQLAQGLPIRMGDILQQSAGRVSRSQLIPQYWEVYYDWAQSVSAKHHLDWVSSISSAQRNDASSIEIAKSNAQNEITFTAIQLGKSQAKMKSLTGNAQPIVPMDSPTVTRVKTNYQAFKNRGMIPPKFEGIDATLMQMHALIASRANTVAMAQKNADEAKQLYSRNQSTVDHVLTAGRTWRTAESDFIASVIEYNKAYADYALALPYGRGPIQTVVNMLIVKPTTTQSASAQATGGRLNLSNNTGASLVSQSNTSENDYSIPYSSNQPNQQNGRSAQSLQGQQPNLTSSNHGGLRHGSNSTGPRTGQSSNSGQASAAHNLMQNAGQASTPRPAAQPSSRFNAGGQASTVRTNANALTENSSPRTNYIKRPSQFPTQQPATGASPFSSATSNPSPVQSLPPRQPNQPVQKPFQPRPGTQAPVGDRTATRPNPFTPTGSRGGASSTPGSTSKPPTNGGGFSFGG